MVVGAEDDAAVVGEEVGPVGPAEVRHLPAVLAVGVGDRPELLGADAPVREERLALLALAVALLAVANRGAEDELLAVVAEEAPPS